MAGRRARGQTREQIIAAARDLFIRDGYEATTVRAIANECGMTDAAIYHHFPSKRALYDEIVVLPEPKARRIDASSHDVGRVAEEIISVNQVWADAAPAFQILVGESLDGNQESIALARNLVHEFHEDIVEIIGDSRGAASRTVADAIALMALGIGVGSISRGHEYWSALLREDQHHARVRRLIGLCLLPPITESPHGIEAS